MTSDAGVPAVIDDQVSARAVALDGERLELRAPRAYAPGQPVSLRLEPPGADPFTVAGKSRGSRRVATAADGAPSFAVTVRLVDLRRGDREALSGALGAP